MWDFEVGDTVILDKKTLNDLKRFWPDEKVALALWSKPMLVTEIKPDGLIGFNYPHAGIPGWTSPNGRFYFMPSDLLVYTPRKKTAIMPKLVAVKTTGICPCKSRICLHGD